MSEIKADDIILDVSAQQAKRSFSGTNRKQSIANEHPITIGCYNLNLSVKAKEKKNAKSSKKTLVEKSILKSVTAQFRPGRLTAIMGASGAGKTTLLNVLAGDKSSKMKQDGKILLNNIPVMGLKKVSGFVYQDDLILSTMTVREAIRMSAILRLPKSISMAEKEERVDDIIDLLGLEKARDTVIGSEKLKGISGGERKRTSIAMEMVTNPAVLFLDEPTSGLDTFTAYQVASRLKALVLTGKTVVATIHQPSSEVFYLFDDLLLLADGQVVYYGPVRDLVGYFHDHGYSCPMYNNPADYIFMNVLNDIEILETRRSDKAKTQVSALIEAWKTSEEAKQLYMEIESNISSTKLDTLDATSIAIKQSRASFLTQFAFLAGRTAKNAIRNFMVLRLKLIRAIFMGLLTGTIYWNIPSHVGYAQFQDRVSALSFILNNEIMSASISTIMVFGEEKDVVRREYQAGYYGISSYYLSKVVTELPFAILSPILSIGISYYMIGLCPNFAKFITSLCTGVLTALVANAQGIFIAAVFPNVQAAITSFPMIILPLMIFGGLMINLKNIPVWYKFMPYISPLKYAFTAMVKNEMEGLTFSNCIPGGNIPCTGEAALKLLGLDSEPSIYLNWAALFGMYCILVGLGYMALRFATRHKSH